MKNYYSIIILLVAIFGVSLSAAELLDGDEIAPRINARDEGEAVSRLLTMEMTDDRGNQRIRETKGLGKY